MILYYNESRIKTKTRVKDKDYIDYLEKMDDITTNKEKFFNEMDKVK